MAEALVSLAICSALLTAVGSGFVAAANSVRTNDEFIRATQSARVIVAQLEDQVRAGWVYPDVATDADGNASQLRLIVYSQTSDVKSPDRTYKYDATRQELILATNAYPADADFVLARNVTLCRFGVDKGVDADGNPAVTQVAITLGVTVGKNQVTLSGSAAPRRSLRK